MRRGPKITPDAVKVLKGTFQPCRARGRAFDPLPADGLIVPKWLKGQALRIWKEKTAVYDKRGQSVVGCEGSLAQYCAVESELIARWKKGQDVPVALINAHRIYANEFYDTPASQQAGGKKTGGENRFTRNGQPPASAGHAG
jgi:hypothetical protein